MAKNGNTNVTPLPPAVSVEPSQTQFAPPGHPDRAEQVARLTAQTIRQACSETGKTILRLVEDAEKQVAVMRDEAQTFAADLERIGNDHADRIESALISLRDVMTTMRSERERVAGMITIQSNPKAGDIGMDAVERALLGEEKKS